MWKVCIYVNGEPVTEIQLDFIPFRELNILIDGVSYFINNVGYSYKNKWFHCHCEVIV